jgi:serine/threonine protein kinase
MTTLENEEKIGSYKILNKIGEGGMAEIYKALQPALKRNVVIKKLKDPNREIIARFKKEALLSASFTQENLVAIYDFLYTNRAYYLVMEHVDGEDLRTLIDHMFPLPVHVAVLIIMEIAHGLEYTHNQGIIHRDIKPSNILISHEGSVKLIDFGVAKDDTNVRLTLTGLIVGTPSYMSPEQAHGDPLSPQSDLYALGILLYEMLTGLKPFYGSNNTEILAKVTRGNYTPPKRINPEISWKLQRVIRKLLKKEKHRRYRNAAALIHALEKCVPWQVRSKKKDVIARFLDALDKTNVMTTDDTLKSALLDKSSSLGWNSLRYSIAASLLLCGFFLFKQFSKKELGYIQLSNPVQKMELKIDNHIKRAVTTKSKLLGPYLQGSHYVEVSDPIANSTFVARTLVSADDTAQVEVKLPQNPGSSGLHISTFPANADVLINGRIMGAEGEVIELSPGWHDIEIRKNGYIAVQDRRFLRAAEFYTMEYSLVQE